MSLCALLVLTVGFQGGAAERAQPLDTTDRARGYLVAAQRPDGSFAPNGFGTRYVRGVTALSALALLGSAKAEHLAAADEALSWLAKNRQVAHMYAHAYATLALARGAARGKAFRDAARAAVRTLAGSQNENGGWGYAPDPRSSRTETCLAAAVLQALHAAKAAGIDVPKETTERALDFLEGQYVQAARMFNNEVYPSPSYGATAMAVAALQLWERTGAAAKGGLSWLARQSVKESTADLRGKPFRGYLRGKFHFELAAHALALRLAKDEKRSERWLARVRPRLAEQQGDDGSFDGWFGKAYGTALVVLTLGGH